MVLSVEDCKPDFLNLLQTCEEIWKKDNDSYKMRMVIPILDSTGFVNCKVEQKTDFRQFLMNHIPEIRYIDSFQEILKKFSKNDSFLNFYSGRITDEDGNVITIPTQENIRPVVEQILKDLLLTYLETKTSFEYDEKIFIDIFDSMKKFVEGDFKSVYCFLPIYGLKGDFESLDFGNFCSIRKLSSSNYAQVVDLDIADNINNKPDSKFWKLRYGLYLKISSDEKLNDLLNLIREKSSKVLETLRLFKSGFIQAGAIYPYSTDSWNRKSLPPRIGDETPANKTSFLQLDSSEFSDIQKLFSEYCAIPFEKNPNALRYLSIAIRRFNSTYEDKFIEDKITNLTMTLEFLLTSGPGEIQNKLSLRGALLLGKTETDREYLWKLIRLCYDVRSDMIHGRKRTQNKIFELVLNDSQLLEELERIVRQTLLYIITLQGQGKSQKEIIDMIDLSVVNREKLIFSNNSGSDQKD